MTERIYRQLPDSCLQVTKSHTSERIRRWCLDWGIDPGAFDVQVTRLGDATCPADGWRKLAGGSGWYWLAPREELELAVGTAMFAVEQPGQIGSVCVADAIAALHPVPEGDLPMGPLQEPPQAGDGRVLVEVSAGSTLLSSVEPCAPTPATRRAVLPMLSAAAREGALRRARVRMRVELGDTELTLRELLQLRPGEVVVLDQSVRHPVRMVCVDSGSEVFAHLGRRGSRFAVQAIRSDKNREMMMNKDTHASVVSGKSPAGGQVHDVDLEELESGATGDQPLLEDRLSLFAGVRTRITAVVGQAEATVGQMLSLKEGETFRLDRHVDAPIDLVVEGQVVARGQLSVVDDQFAVRVTEVVQAGSK